MKCLQLAALYGFGAAPLFCSAAIALPTPPPGPNPCVSSDMKSCKCTLRPAGRNARGDRINDLVSCDPNSGVPAPSPGWTAASGRPEHYPLHDGIGFHTSDARTKLRAISPGAFDHPLNTLVTALDLRFNYLGYADDSLRPGSFAGLHAVTTIDLRNNSIYWIDDLARVFNAANLSSLTTVRLEGGNPLADGPCPPGSAFAPLVLGAAAHVRVCVRTAGALSGSLAQRDLFAPPPPPPAGVCALQAGCPPLARFLPRRCPPEAAQLKWVPHEAGKCFAFEGAGAASFPCDAARLPAPPAAYDGGAPGSSLNSTFGRCAAASRMATVHLYTALANWDTHVATVGGGGGGAGGVAAVAAAAAAAAAGEERAAAFGAAWRWALAEALGGFAEAADVRIREVRNLTCTPHATPPSSSAFASHFRDIPIDPALVSASSSADLHGAKLAFDGRPGKDDDVGAGWVAGAPGGWTFWQSAPGAGHAPPQWVQFKIRRELRWSEVWVAAYDERALSFNAIEQRGLQEQLYNVRPRTTVQESWSPHRMTLEHGLDGLPLARVGGGAVTVRDGRGWQRLFVAAALPAGYYDKWARVIVTHTHQVLTRDGSVFYLLTTHSLFPFHSHFSACYAAHAHARAPGLPAHRVGAARPAQPGDAPPRGARAGRPVLAGRCGGAVPGARHRLPLHLRREPHRHDDHRGRDHQAGRGRGAGAGAARGRRRARVPARAAVAQPVVPARRRRAALARARRGFGVLRRLRRRRPRRPAARRRRGAGGA